MIKAIPLTGNGRPVFDARQLQRDLSNLMTATAKAIKVDYGVTTQTWKHRPTFEILGNAWERQIFTTDPVFGFVDKGTRPHTIAPKAGGVLAFGAGPYKAKTKPRVIASSGGAGGGGPRVMTRKAVHHPGTEARAFTETIAEKWEPIFADKANAIMRGR